MLCACMCFYIHVHVYIWNLLYLCSKFLYCSTCTLYMYVEVDPKVFTILCGTCNSVLVHLHAYSAYTWMYMNNHLHRAPQCTRESIRKERKKTHANTRAHHNTIPPHTQQPQCLNGLEIVYLKSLRLSIVPTGHFWVIDGFVYTCVYVYVCISTQFSQPNALLTVTMYILLLQA